jgi:hypothetical protein
MAGAGVTELGPFFGHKKPGDARRVSFDRRNQLLTPVGNKTRDL